MIVLWIVTVVFFLLLRTLFVWIEIQSNRQRGHLAAAVAPTTKTTKRRRRRPVSTTTTTLVVLGSGGHTTEMLFMIKHLVLQQQSSDYEMHYCKASTDSTSMDRLRTMMMRTQQQNNNNPNDDDDDGDIVIHNIPRSREVGQSYFSSIFTTLYAFLFAFVLVAWLRPKLILCNGPGTCIPICVAATLFRIIGVLDVHIVFIESYCRVQTLSLTGKLLYNTIADLFIVHWKELHEKYPKTVLTSTFIQQQ